ncbi:methionine synthase reductase [Epargyreus clarus]|uniref:methionine synthase reductase n=1 Tax=Epargyreus clarus TaxID=520877 RepID=UPI003C2E74F9
MVVTESFQDIFDESVRVSALNLPKHKESGLKIEYGNSKELKTQYSGAEPQLPFAASEIFHADVISWRRLTAVDKACKAVYEVTFDIKGSNFTFKPGDTIGILPHNNKDEVDFLIHHLGVAAVADLSYELTIDSSRKATKCKIPPHIPINSTIRHVLTHCVDFRAVVKKLFLLALSRHTKDDAERKVLEFLCSKEGSAAYNTHILNKNTCLLDLLANFKSCKPPIEILYQHLPRLLPRPYSIVNSSLKSPNMLKIGFSVIDIGKNRKGLTTGWIEDIITNNADSLEDSLRKLSIKDKEEVPIYLRKNINGFQLPENDVPLILIGPGTGVSPYIGFLEELEYLRMGNKSKQAGPIWLFFGCRNPTLDFIYKEELNGFLEKNVLSCLKTAFSRYGDYETKYVQDAIMENGKEVVKLLKDGAKVFVCGDLKTMATQVKDTLVNCLVKYDGNSTEEAEKNICDMQKNKSYIIDIWN